MIFKCYQLSLNQQSVYINEIKEIQDFIFKRLLMIEKEIIKEYINAQNDKIGIKTLGNKLQYNKSFKNLFGNISNNVSLIQATENKRAFLKLLFETLKNHNSNIIYFFILDKTFGKASNLVDGTFINIDDIKKNLELVIQSSTLKNNIDLRIIEFRNFSDYYIETTGEYSKIVKLKND